MDQLEGYDPLRLGFVGYTMEEGLAILAARPKPLNLACPHRGGRVGDITCTGCCDKKTILFVFACDLHERCLLGPTREGVRGCDGGCDDLPAKKQLDLTHGKG